MIVLKEQVFRGHKFTENHCYDKIKLQKKTFAYYLQMSLYESFKKTLYILWLHVPLDGNIL